MDDLISRQMAIKHLKKRLYETALNNNTEHPYYEEMADNRVDVWMNEVPSAQPNLRPTCNQLATDCISRQAAIDAIKALWNDAPSAQHVSAMFDCEDTIRVLPSAQPEQEWIPCSERMPDEDYCSGRGVQCSEPVLVTVVNHENDEDIFVDTACTADGEWQLRDDNPLAPEWCEVVAWMPLPEPYTEEKKE